MSKHEELFDKVAQHDENGLLVRGMVAHMLDDLERIAPKAYDVCIEQMEDVAYSITRSDAESIVRNMTPSGQRWSYGDVADFLKTKDNSGNPVDYYLCMNMAYNDYINTAKLYGLQKDPEFFYSVAYDFINDEDAKPHKVARYFIG